MNPAISPAQKLQPKRNRITLRKNCRGMTLVEVMVAVSLFTLMAMGALTALIQTRKMSEDNVAQATTQVIAQGILEQVQLIDYNTLTDATNLSLKFRFTSPTSGNSTAIQQFTLPWALDATTFTDVGTKVDPTDPASATLGVMIDLPYMNGTTQIRPVKYMKMRVNLQRIPHTTDDNVEIILTYSYQPPSGNGAAASRFITREIRTIRSKASSY